MSSGGIFTTDFPPPANPVIDYSSRDYASIYQDLMARKQVFLPSWTSESPNDFGIVFIQMLAYVGDILNYYLDRLAAEAFIQTATQPESILNFAQMLNYIPTLSVGAQAELTVTMSTAASGSVTIPPGQQFQTPGSPTSPPVVFTFLGSGTGNTVGVTIPGNTVNPAIYSASVPVVQGVVISNESVATSDGTIDQAYPLQQQPVSALATTGEPSAVVSVDVGLGPQPWTWVPALIDYGPADQVFTSFVDANGIFYVVFGDGVNGSVPPLGSPITCTYQVCVGSAGNVGAGTINEVVGSIVGVTAVTNASAATGGSDPESLASIQTNAPAALMALNRAITTTDMEVIAQQTPGVQWASAVSRTYQQVSLYIAPSGGGQPSTALQTAVANALAPVTLANTTVSVASATSYIPINISATAQILPNYGTTATQNAIQAALAAFFNLLNTGFGYRVSLGSIYQAIMGVEGVAYAQVTSMYRQILATLVTPLVSGTAYTSLNVTPLPGDLVNAQGVTPIVVNGGDVLTITNPNDNTQSGIIVATNGAPSGATIIPVQSFTADASFPIGSTLTDPVGAQDCVLLPSEIPTLGTLTLVANGGIPGS